MMLPHNLGDIDAIKGILKDGPPLHCAYCGQSGAVPQDLLVHGDQWISGNRLSLRFYLACSDEEACSKNRQSN